METPTPQSMHDSTGQLYNENAEIEDGHFQCTNRIAFHVTLRTILARLPDRPGLKILDVGGGTGPYSFALASRGHSVTLVDASADRRGLAEARATSASSPAPARILQRDATRLSNHPTLADEHGRFDAVLFLRPLSHIAPAGLRAAALHDAWDFVSPRGDVVFCGWVSRLAHYRRLALTDPAALAREREFYAQHTRDGHYVNTGEEVQRAMHHELPERMPEILRDATGMEDAEMVGAEGLLAGVGQDGERAARGGV